MTDRPFLLVIAGPNGSGKSTLTRYLLESGVDFGIYINPDEIALTLDMPEPERTKQAQAIADFKRSSCVQHRHSFSFETVMSHPSKVEVMIQAHDAGFDVTLFFVATSDPEINVRRVENRVATGGHDVPHDRVRSRYGRSLSYLAHAALVAQRTVVFDNSALVMSGQINFPGGRSGLHPVAEVVRIGNRYFISLDEDAPEWVLEHLMQPVEAVARASDGGVEVVLGKMEGRGS